MAVVVRLPIVEQTHHHRRLSVVVVDTETVFVKTDVIYGDIIASISISSILRSISIHLLPSTQLPVLKCALLCVLFSSVLFRLTTSATPAAVGI